MNFHTCFALGKQIDESSDDSGGFGLGDLGEEGANICQQRSHIIKPVQLGKERTKEINGLLSDFDICICGGFVRKNNFAKELDGVVGVGFRVFGGFVKQALKRGHGVCVLRKRRREKGLSFSEGKEKKERRGDRRRKNKQTNKKKNKKTKNCSKRKKFAITPKMPGSMHPHGSLGARSRRMAKNLGFYDDFFFLSFCMNSP